ncbi:MAG: hypothetical protein A2Z83_02255 [Omnitrophica bacterium GWA2_52_8]|nr:MAG: hypothetical protein A2Z83_02255 [Omnitrophica bacterium GWA2_52_8]
MDKTGRKLKRGLKDLSPLFHGEGEAASTEKKGPEAPSRPSQCLYVMSPNHQEDSMFLNAYLATGLLKMHQPAVIVSFYPESLKKGAQSPQESPGLIQGEQEVGVEILGNGLKRFSLSWSQFYQKCCGLEPAERVKESGHPFLFLEFDCVKSPALEKVIPLIDKWIFVVDHEPYSIQETYKTIKASRLYNPHLEYFMVFEGPREDGRGEQLYEKFSELVTRRLGVSISWLGTLQFPEEKNSMSRELMLEDLLPSGKGGCESIEKQALIRYLHAVENGSMGMAV